MSSYTENNTAENNTIEVICVSCPMGCGLRVNLNRASGAISVTGHECPAGKAHGEKEMTNPTRNIATSVRVSGGSMPMLSVKTASPIPKASIMDVVREIHKVKPRAPVSIGDVVLADAAGTGVDIVATRHVGVLPCEQKKEDPFDYGHPSPEEEEANERN